MHCAIQLLYTRDIFFVVLWWHFTAPVMIGFMRCELQLIEMFVQI